MMGMKILGGYGDGGGDTYTLPPILQSVVNTICLFMHSYENFVQSFILVVI